MTERSAPLLVVLLALAVLAPPAVAHLNHLAADTQMSPDGVVYVESASAAGDAWLVLHDRNGTPVGHTRLDASDGTATDVPVTVTPRAWAGTAGGRTVLVDLYLDDGDGTFDAGSDARLSRTGLFDPATITVGRGKRAYVGVSDEQPQATSGTVEIRRVAIPAAGHLVLRDAPGGGPDTVVGHTALRAGEHRGVAVRLNRTFLRSSGDTVRLWASLAVDDGDGAFDRGDSRVRAGDDPVRTTFRIEKRPETPDTTRSGASTRSGAATSSSPESGPASPADPTVGTPGPVSPFTVGAVVCGLAVGVYFAVSRQ